MAAPEPEATPLVSWRPPSTPREGLGCSRVQYFGYLASFLSPGHDRLVEDYQSVKTDQFLNAVDWGSLFSLDSSSVRNTAGFWYQSLSFLTPG